MRNDWDYYLKDRFYDGHMPIRMHDFLTGAFRVPQVGLADVVRKQRSKAKYCDNKALNG
jgi:hypothetical protein